MKIGLTGGIGCGKTTVLRAFAQAGIATIETDAIVRQLLAEDASLLAGIRAEFGPAVFNAEGMVDRAVLAHTVFADSRALACLESLVHPRVREVWMRALRENAAGMVVEIPLLFEKDLQPHFDVTVCVGSSRPVQIARLLTRGMTLAQIEQRIGRQWPLVEKMQRADIQLHNNGTVDHLRKQVNLFLQTHGDFYQNGTGTS